MSLPVLSVVVTIVEGQTALPNCLQALVSQLDAPRLEIIVPFDDSVGDLRSIAESFPTCDFVSMGQIDDTKGLENAFVQHERFDRRRAVGLARARGEFIAMIEDRCIVAHDWARTMVALHQFHRSAVIGGPVENVSRGIVTTALFLCDFGRYQRPVEAIDPPFITDINVCYKRGALREVQPLWDPIYREATVHWALADRGLGLRLSDQPLVHHRRSPMGLGAILRERIAWGRVFGQTRGRQLSRGACLGLAAASPLLPGILLLRIVRSQLRKRRPWSSTALALPAMVLLLMFWSLGEFLGYGESAVAKQRPLCD